MVRVADAEVRPRTMQIKHVPEPFIIIVVIFFFTFFFLKYPLVKFLEIQ
jgi:hypothetical protein